MINRLLDETVLIGRGRALLDVDALLEGACEGAGQALIVRGEAGIGKTTLLVRSRQLAGELGMRVLSCSGVPAESNLAFAALHQLLRPVMPMLSVVPARQARLLRAALGSDDLPPVDLYGVALATLELLASAAADQPILIAADDAHWIDRPSADVLAFVGRRVASEPIAVFVGVREGTGDPFAGPDLLNLILEPLDLAASAALLERVAPDLSYDLRERVLRDAGGNPLALIQLPLTVHLWGLSADRTPVADLLEQSFAARTADLPDRTHALLLAAAAGAECDLAELCSAASQARGTDIVPADLQPAIDARLITLVNEQIVFSHPVLASVIYQTATVDQRLRVHAALANVVDDDRRTWHQAAAAVGRDDDLAEEMTTLADRAVRRGAISISIAALDRAAALTHDRTHESDILLKASEQAVELGRRGLAMSLVARADHAHLSPVGAARLTIVQDELHLRGSDPGLTAQGLVKVAMSARESGDVDLAASVLWTLARRCYWTNGSMEDRIAVDAAARALDLNDADPRRIAILAFTGLSHQRADLERQVQLADVQPDDAVNLEYLAASAINLCAYETGAQLLTDAVTTSRRRGRLTTIPRLQALQAWAAFWTGTLDSVTVAAGESERLSGELDQPIWLAASTIEHALVAGFRGNYASAKNTILMCASDDKTPANRLSLACAVYALAMAALGAGAYEDAYTYLRRLVDPGDPVSHYAARWWVAGDLVEAAVRTGRLNECTHLLQDLEAEWRLSPTSAVRSKVAYGATFLVPDGDAEERFRLAYEAEPPGDDFTRGRLNLAYGIWLRRRRRNREARPPLANASEFFNRIGMVGFAQQAGRELRAAGGADMRQHGVGPAGLTPQELQIAQLAAEGLSNRQIAEKLFLSHRTVSSHLYRLYPKLGITSRAELRAVLRSRR